MAKNSKDQIETDEHKILSELMKNAKENIDTIAKNCGFSRQKVWKMIKQLEQDQKIWGYSAVIDNEKLNLQKFILFVRGSSTRHTADDKEEIVGDLLAPLKTELGVTMISSYRIHGQYDWVMLFTATDILHAKRFSNSIMQRFPGRQDIHISQILYTVRENYIRNPDKIKMKNFI